MNCREQCGTELFSVIKRNQPDILKLLIEKGVNLNVQNKYGNTALMCAIFSDLPRHCLDID